MAFPATGIEATYRNDIDEVSRMLQTYHKNNYMIWNLRFDGVHLSLPPRSARARVHCRACACAWRSLLC
jgi:hypothetical protein